jgi:hypothetical protein
MHDAALVEPSADFAPAASPGRNSAGSQGIRAATRATDPRQSGETRGKQFIDVRERYCYGFTRIEVNTRLSGVQVGWVGARGWVIA